MQLSTARDATIDVLVEKRRAPVAVDGVAMPFGPKLDCGRHISDWTGRQGNIANGPILREFLARLGARRGRQRRLLVRRDLVLRVLADCK
jgi:hypothetical protein